MANDAMSGAPAEHASTSIVQLQSAEYLREPGEVERSAQFTRPQIFPDIGSYKFSQQVPMSEPELRQDRTPLPSPFNLFITVFTPVAPFACQHSLKSLVVVNVPVEPQHPLIVEHKFDRSGDNHDNNELAMVHTSTSMSQLHVGSSLTFIMPGKAEISMHLATLQI
jgi:hypothetical protein